MRRWSDRAWEAAEPVYRRITEHPFVEALAAGSLSEERFRHYLRQDALYLDGYARRLAHIAARLMRKGAYRSLPALRPGGHRGRTGAARLLSRRRAPLARRDQPRVPALHLRAESQATAPVEVEAAAVLPCFVVYQRVGEEILARQQDDRNPYRRWIETYGDASFAEATARAVGICDELAEAASEEIRQRMTDLFVRCTRMEWMFWESAWNLEKWKI